MIHSCVVLGTRPEAIKLAPVIHELERRSEDFRLTVCATAQHRHLLDQVTRLFHIPIHHDLDVMRAGQKLEEVTARVLTGISQVFRKDRPDVVIAQGDTTTTFVAGLAAFYQRIPVAHVEAGLRTQDRFAPYPEEINRRLTSHLADFHFAPTPWAQGNLLREGIRPDTIFVTGNTVVESFLEARRRVLAAPPRIPELDGFDFDRKDRKLILVTAHRRENFGAGIEGICRALSRIVSLRKDVEIVFPVHPNPNVRGRVQQALGDSPRIHLIEPLDYFPFVWLAGKACLVLTDSGGVQEEVPSLGLPVLVMRDKTERPEGVEAGVCRLVGTAAEVIEREVIAVLEKSDRDPQSSPLPNPFGDGHAAERIVEHLARLLGSAEGSQARPNEEEGKTG
ncbi:MAG: UDP-N-acetylglucosamine 2-epimerase (non-hydrolyzing) [Acidobacteria bacterium]|nr:UDP-N-acetylglucosamine 2-epimerase (non-hydrolyzing) [Acidobacteriota bacterium]